MVLARELVHEARNGCVRYQDAGLGKGVRGPDIGEGSTASVNPEAGILRVPGTVRIGIGTVSGVVRIHAGAIRIVGAVAAQKPDIVNQRVFAGVPGDPDRPGVKTAGETPDAGDAVGSN